MQPRESVPVIQADTLPLFGATCAASVRYLPHKARRFTFRGLSARPDPAHSAARRYTPIGPGPQVRSPSQPTNTIQK